MLFLCLPKEIYFHFDLLEGNLSFSDANMPFYMPVWGGQLSSKCSQIQKYLNSIRLQEGSAILKVSEIKKKVSIIRGGGGEDFPSFNYDGSPNQISFFPVGWVVWVGTWRSQE